MAGGNSHQRAVERAARARMVEEVTKEVLQGLQESTSTVRSPMLTTAMEVRDGFWAKVFNVIENPWILGALFLLGGIVGTVLFTPALILCAVCVLFGFHRSKVAAGLHWGAQLAVFMALTLVLSAGGYVLYRALNSKLQGIQTEFAKLVASFVKPVAQTQVSSLPPSPQPRPLPHITVTYEPSNLPIRIQHGDKVWICSLEKDKTMKSGWMEDPFGVPKVWPVDKQTLPPVEIGTATVRTDQNVFNFSMDLTFNTGQTEFHSDVLRPGKNQKIYFINRSDTIMAIRFPESATFEVGGTPKRQASTISLDGFVSEAMPSLRVVPPSFLKWDRDRLLDSNGKPMY